jgi:hypothetical protein
LFQTATKSQNKQDSLAIKETVEHYIEGWYSGSADRMGKSLHPELAKRGVLPTKDGSNTEIAKASYEDMIKWTGLRPDLLKENKVSKNDLVITILEIGQNIANVKCLSVDFIDYLHLMRTNNEWKILNAIWEPNYAQIMKKK